LAHFIVSLTDLLVKQSKRKVVVLIRPGSAGVPAALPLVSGRTSPTMIVSRSSRPFADLPTPMKITLAWEPRNRAFSSVKISNRR